VTDPITEQFDVLGQAGGGVEGVLPSWITRELTASAVTLPSPIATTEAAPAAASAAAATRARLDRCGLSEGTIRLKHARGTDVAADRSGGCPPPRRGRASNRFRPMHESAAFEAYVRNGLGTLGIEPDEIDMAVIAAADGVWGTAMRELMAADLHDIEPEVDPDLSSAPSR
jgi:hypothetical protein